MIQKKENWEEIQKFIESKNIQCLFHFTDKANLDSIKKYRGLYSWYYCKRRGIVIPRPGGNELSRNLDFRNYLGNFVRLSFIEEPPLLHRMIDDGRIVNPVIIEVDVEALYWDKTKYSNMNATTNDKDLNIGDKLEDLKKIKFKVFDYDYLTILNKANEYKKYYHAEILVYEKIPIEFLK